MQPVKEYTFDNFIIDTSNQLAFVAARYVADNPGQRYNPLFIYGESGLGKTHLLNAIYNRINEHNPDAVICMLAAEEIEREMMHALTEKQTDSWHKALCSADVLLIDNAHILMMRPASQKKFVSILRSYVAKGNQIVMTSSLSPESLPVFVPDFRVVRDGLLADIQPLNVEVCRMIALDKAVRRGLWLSKESLEYIALHANGKTCRLEDIISRLHAEKKLTGSTLSYEAVKRACEE